MTRARLEPERHVPRAERKTPRRRLLCGAPDRGGRYSCGGFLGFIEITETVHGHPVTWMWSAPWAFRLGSDGVYRATEQAAARARIWGGHPRPRAVSSQQAGFAATDPHVSGPFQSYLKHDTNVARIACPRCDTVQVVDAATGRELCGRIEEITARVREPRPRPATQWDQWDDAP